MELGMTWRAYLTMPLRWWPPSSLGLTLGLFMFAVLTFNSAMRVLPKTMISSSTISLASSLSTLIHKSPLHPYMPYLNQSVGSSHDQSSSPSIDLKSSVVDQSNHIGHVDNGFVSSPNSNDVRLSLADNITNDDLKSSLANRTDGRMHVHDEFSSSTHNSTNPNCDIYIGRWVEDYTYPFYKPDSCPFVDKKFNCEHNGRPDAKYTRWRWAPRDCNVPRFNGRDMLERLRGKRLVFVGDSLNRNQWHSMLCMLRESLDDKTKIIRPQGSVHIFKFLDYDCTVEFYKAPYLVDMQEGSNKTDFIIRLDTMDKSETEWRNANVLVFNTAQWWGPHQIGQGDNCFQEGSKVYQKFDVTVAYNKALSKWAKWVDDYVNPQNTSVFFRSYSPLHYQGDQWGSRRQCQDEREPINNESYVTPYSNKMHALESVLQEMRVPVHVLNITRLSDYRKDAHPAEYWQPQQQVVPRLDCGHWCLPGLPDTWNELLYFAISNKMRISL